MNNGDINGTVDGVNIKEFSTLDKEVQELIQAAIQVRERAYCPYSNFKVGAALRTITGQIITGCNVENAAYGPTVCAERSAVCKGVSEGYREFTACAVVAYQENGFVSPCGTCRQFMAEFANKDFPVYMSKPSPNNIYISSIYKLLPDGLYGKIDFS